MLHVSREEFDFFVPTKKQKAIHLGSICFIYIVFNPDQTSATAL